MKITINTIYKDENCIAKRFDTNDIKSKVGELLQMSVLKIIEL